MSLDPLFRPRSVAVVGASRNPGSIGWAVVHNLLSTGFQGPVWAVNPHARSVHSLPSWPSLADVPGEVDLAVLTVPRDGVLPAVLDAERKGVKALVTITAGFKEASADGARLEAQITEVVRRSGMRMVGPNCMGVLSTDPDVRLNASFAAHEPPPGPVAFASQSGALGEAILETARDLGLGISAFVSLGNKADVSGNDLIEHWGKDPRTRLVLLYLESFGNPQRFARLAREVTRTQGKPIIAVKSGRTRKGAEAASSHTGSLAGGDAAVDSLLAQCGVLRAGTVEELFAMAQAFAYQPLPQGRRLGILTNAGGPAIMATDAAVTQGLDLPTLGELTLARMRSVLPAEASLRNPVDMIASAGPAKFRECAAAMLADERLDALLVIFVAPATTDAAAVARAIAESVAEARAQAGPQKPVLVCFMGRPRGDEGMAHLRRQGVPVYAFPEAAVLALEAMTRFQAFRTRDPGQVPALDPAPDRRRARAVIDACAPGWLPFDRAMDVLGCYGIPVAPWAIVDSPEAAEAFARVHGYPVVLKVDSDAVLHKSERGAVQVDLRNARELRGAFWEIDHNLRGVEGPRRFVVQAMVQGGKECIIGASADPAFGHLVAFGLGGVFVELMKDVVFRLAPVTDVEAREMIEGIKGYPLLAGARGQAPVDLRALQDVLLRFSQLVADLPEIAEIDLNPFFAHSDASRQAAADVRIRVTRSGAEPVVAPLVEAAKDPVIAPAAH